MSYKLVCLYFIVWLLYIEVKCQLFDLPQPTQPPIPLVWSEQKKTIYPNPRGSSPDKCNCDSDNCYICDPNYVLSGEDVIKINNRLLEMRNIGVECYCLNDTQCNYNGIPIAIAIMNEFELNTEEVMESFAEHFFSSWQFQTCYDGIIYVIGKNSNPVVFRRYGKTAHTRFVDETCQSFVNESSFELYKQGRITEAILMDIDIYTNITLYGKESCTSTFTTKNNLSNIAIIIGILLTVIAMIIFIIVLVCCFRKKRNVSTVEQRRMISKTI